MALGADDVQTALGGDAVAELDVGTAARHVGRDRHLGFLARVLDDLSFLLVILRVENVALDALAPQHRREQFALFDRTRTDENRAALAVLGDDLVDDGIELGLLRLVHDIGVVFASHRAVGRNDDDVETIDVAELALFGLCRTGHAGEMIVQTEEILEGDRRERLILAANLDAFFRFDRLVDTVGVTASVHQTAGELVDDDHFAVFDDVLLIAMEQIPRLERCVELMRELDVALIVEVRNAEHLLDLRDAGFRDRNGVRLLIDGVVFVFLQARDNLREIIVELGRLLRRSADNERRARFVDENRVDFVDEREVELALHEVFHLPRHVVAQIVEADFVVRDVRDVAGVLRAAFRRRKTVLNDADGQARGTHRADPSTRRRAERDSRSR